MAEATELDHRISDHGVGRGVIVGKFLRPAEGHRRAGRGGDSGDLVVVGGHHDTVEQTRLEGGSDRPANDRFAAEPTDVLAWDSLAPAPGRDDAPPHVHRL